METESVKPAPPKIAPKPGKVTVLRALYGYTAQQEDELSFNEGDVLYLVDQSNPDWWKARCGRRLGLIPSNYVEMKMDTIENPLHDAARRGNIEFLRDCLANGVSPTGLDSTGNSPIHWTARGGHLECLQELVAAAVKQFSSSRQFINAQNKLGETPLHMAASKDHLAIVQFLVENEACPTIRNKEGRIPVDLSHDPSVQTVLRNTVYVPNDNEEDDDEYLQASDDEEGNEDEAN